MNINLIGSAIIGGLMLLSILGVNGLLVENSIESIADYQVKYHTSTIAGVLSYDLRKIGYLYNDGFPLDSISSHLIRFNADVTGDGDADTVQWVFAQSLPDLITPNPGDTSLFRVVNDDTTDFSGGVITFAFTYYDSLGQVTTIADSTKSIHVNLLCESKEHIGNRFLKSAWSQHFQPINLEIFH